MGLFKVADLAKHIALVFKSNHFGYGLMLLIMPWNWKERKFCLEKFMLWLEGIVLIASMNIVLIGISF